MKRLALIVLCFLLTGCSYFGSTEDILISSPASLSIIRMETFDTPYSSTTPSSSQGSPNNTSAPQISDTDSSDITPSVTSTTPSATAPVINELILNKSGKTIHYYENCSYVTRMKPENRGSASAVMEDALIGQGYKVCSWCAKH